MKLIACHIENYGALSGVDYKFNDELTQYFWGNGEGKTTLCSFIKAMFYGLPTWKTGNKFNERVHFYPFNSGKFGGNLTFEQNGKTYKIERFFDKFNEAHDNLRVLCEGSEVSLGEKIGRTVFGIDEEAFKRTVFISADEIDIASTDSINAKLKNFVEGADGEVGFKEALEALNAAAKKLKAAKGNSDKISRQSEKISELRREVENYSAIEGGLGSLYASRKELCAQVEELDRTSRQTYENKIESEKWAAYDRYVEELAQKESRKRELENLPDEDELDGLQSKINEINALRAEVELSGGREDVRLNALKAKFDLNTPDMGQVERIKATVDEYKTKRARLESIPAVAASADEVSGGKNIKPALIAFLAAAIALLGAGIGLFFVNLIAGIVLTVLGVLGLVATGFLYFNAKMKRVESSSPVHINAEAVALQAETKRLEDAVYSFLAPYGYYTGNGVVFDFAKFEEDFGEYAKSKESDRNSQRALLEKTEKLNGLSLSTAERLKALGVEDIELQQGVNLLRARVGEYKALAVEIEQLKTRAEEYKKQNGLVERPADMPEIKDVTDQLNQTRLMLSRLDRAIEEDEKKVELLAEKRALLAEAEEELVRLNSRHSLITAAIKKLKTAEQNLIDKYIAPVKDGFIKYSGLLEKSLGEKITMDKSFKITFERGGEDRSDKHFSSGQRAICMLCFRLALIDEMYEEEKPFIVMDDPFVFLDREHMQSAAELVKLLSPDKQIIYFCCHESRKVIV